MFPNCNMFPSVHTKENENNIETQTTQLQLNNNSCVYMGGQVLTSLFICASIYCWSIYYPLQPQWEKSTPSLVPRISQDDMSAILSNITRSSTEPTYGSKSLNPLPGPSTEPTYGFQVLKPATGPTPANHF